MKKYSNIAILTGMISLVSCTETGMDFSFELQKEIAFRTEEITGMKTRTVMETTLSMLKESGFRVLAKNNSDSKGLFNSIVKKEGDVWKVPGKTYYYPVEGSMDFYAVYPGALVPEMKGDDVIIRYDAKNPETDLVVAKNRWEQGASSAVPLVFAHVLSQVQLMCKGGTSGVEYNLKRVAISAPGCASYSYADNNWSEPDSSAVFNVLASDTILSTSTAVTVGETMTFIPGEISVTIDWACSKGGVGIGTFRASLTLSLAQGKKSCISISLPDCDGEAIVFTASTGEWEDSRQEISVQSVIEPLKFEAGSVQNVYMDNWCCDVSLCGDNFEYSYDGEHWTKWDDITSPLTFGTTEHPYIMFRGDNPEGIGYWCEDCDWPEGLQFVFSDNDTPVRCTGNVMSLINYNTRISALPGSGGCLANLLAETPISGAPELPATELVDGCYTDMFYGCPFLTKAPALPARIMKKYCYDDMFQDCSALVEAPDLQSLFLAEGCYAYMFDGCPSLTEAPRLPASRLEPYCYYGMFRNCSSLTDSPVLPADKLEYFCYGEMFSNCLSLERLYCCATDISAENCLDSWLENVPPSGYAVKFSGVEFPEGGSGIPENWRECNMPFPYHIAILGNRVAFSPGNLYWDKVDHEFGFKYPSFAMDVNEPLYTRSHFYYSPERDIALMDNYDEDIMSDESCGLFAERGGAVPGWTVLTRDEFEFVFQKYARKNSNGEYEFSIGGITCLVLSPNTFSDAIPDSYTRDEWVRAEKEHGLVALPFAGHRNGGSLEDTGKECGFFTKYSNYISWIFTEEQTWTSWHSNKAYPVRLVKPIDSELLANIIAFSLSGQGEDVTFFCYRGTTWEQFLKEQPGSGCSFVESPRIVCYRGIPVRKVHSHSAETLANVIEEGGYLLEY